MAAKDKSSSASVAIQRFQTLQERYIITSILKEDAKGDVFKALYLKNVILPTFCVIKQGRAFRSEDEAGRDMTDRIFWQQSIHQELHTSVNIPKPLAYFIEEGDHFLVTQHIPGRTLEAVIRDICRERCWLHMPVITRLELLTLLLKVLKIVELTHSRGYVHRDLNHVNFIVTPKGHVFLIDWELAYGMKERYPMPAFKLGTHGFMSPEQLNGHIPTVKEDIYALGALMFVFFTGMSPSKLDLQNIIQVRKAVLFFTNDLLISTLVCQCLVANPSERPEITYLNDLIGVYIEKVNINSGRKRTVRQYVEIKVEDIDQLLLLGYKGFITHEVTANHGLFQLLGAFDPISGARNQRGISIGLMSPILGILLVLTAEDDLDEGVRQYFKDFVSQHATLFSASADPELQGLYDGATGQGLSVYFCWKMKLLPPAFPVKKLICRCFSANLRTLDLATGTAGQLLALCQICKADTFSLLKERLQELTDSVLNRQRPDGSWVTDTDLPKNEGLQMALENGVAGIIVALIHVDKLLPEPKIKEAIQNAFSFLVSHNRAWLLKYDSNSSMAGYSKSLAFGSSGLALTFLYGYEHLGKDIYRRAAEKLLKTFKNHPVDQDFSLATGLAGRGFVYAEAFRILQDTKWLDQALWIYRVFESTIHKKPNGAVLWRAGVLNEYDVGLLSGSAGIVLFLQKLKQVKF